MAEQNIVRAAGLNFSPNDLSETPEGSLFVADNVLVRRPGILEPRRGSQLASTVGLTVDNSKGMFFYRDVPIVADGSDLLYLNGTVFGNFGLTLSQPQYSIRAEEMNKSAYFTTGAGIFKMESLSGTPAQAGMVKAMDLNFDSYQATNTWMNNDTAVAYQCVFGRYDTNNVLTVGAPSGRELVRNSTGVQKSVRLRVRIPPECNSNHILYVYRSWMTLTANLEPSADTRLVYQYQLLAADITAGYFQFDDIVPDELTGATGYWCPSQEGLLQANERPPMATDITKFKGHMFYANTTAKHRMILTLITAVNNMQVTIGGQSYNYEDPSSSGLVDAWTPSSSTAGLSVSQKIEMAAKTLVNAINMRNILGVASRTGAYGSIYAFYISGPDDFPGKILLEEVSIGGNPYYLGAGSTVIADYSPTPATNIIVTSASTSRTANVVTVTTATAHGFSSGKDIVLGVTGAGGASFWDGGDTNFKTGVKKNITVSSGTVFTYAEAGANAVMTSSYVVHAISQPSLNDIAANRIFYSKLQQPDAVPLLNYIDVGGKDQQILRIVGIRESLFIFKEDGCYRLTGDDEFSFRVDPFDVTIDIVGRDTIVNLDNEVFCLTTKGVMAVSDTGVRVVSRGVYKGLLDAIATAGSTAVINYAWACAYEAEGLYMLWLPTSSADTYARKGWIYSVLSDAWTNDTRGMSIGGVNAGAGADGKFYYINPAYPTHGFLLKERKALSWKDFADQYGGEAITVTSHSGATLVLSNTTGVSSDDIIEQDVTGLCSRVISVDSGTSLTIEDSLAWTNAATVRLLKPYTCDIVFAPFFAEPSYLKKFRHLSFIFRRLYGPECQIGYGTDFVRQNQTTIDLKRTTGLGLWSSANSGPDTSIPGLTNAESPYTVKFLIPRDFRRGGSFYAEFKTNKAFASFFLEGYVPSFEVTSDRIRRS